MNKLLVLFLCLGLAGCATPYQSQGFMGGFKDIKLQDNVFKVSFNGNGYSDKERTVDFALLRSAELTLENGYKYFVILGSSADVQTSAYTTPVTAQTDGTGNTYFSGGETSIINKPSTSMTIQCFKDKPTGVSGMIYDAEQVKTNLRKAYKLDEEAKPKEAPKPVVKTNNNFKG